ncbi:MAG TPA: hypothetical protein VF883_03440 [Thermoanaerobaculia bacterium]|jgi:hypothetical protein
MAKNVTVGHDQRVDGRYTDRKPDASPSKGARREILFPTEATTIDRKKIDRAIARVISKKK